MKIFLWVLLLSSFALSGQSYTDTSVVRKWIKADTASISIRRVHALSQDTIAVLEGGYIKYRTKAEIISNINPLLVDQTTPQTIINGIPELDSTRTYSNDNQLTDRRYVLSLASGGMKSFYFTKTASSVAGMYKAKTFFPNAALDTFQRTVGDGSTILVSFITDTATIPYRVIEGNRFFYITAAISNTARPVQLKGKIYTTNLAGGDTVLLRESNLSRELTETSSQYIMSVYGDSKYITTTTRILFQVIAVKTGPGGSPVVTLSVDNNTFSRLDVPSPVGVTDSCRASYKSDTALVSAYATRSDTTRGAVRARYADSSGHSGHASFSDSALNADFAWWASYADSSGHSGHATYADTSRATHVADTVLHAPNLQDTARAAGEWGARKVPLWSDVDDPTGFVDRTAVLSWKSGASGSVRRFFITGNHDIYVDGIKRTMPTDSIQVADATSTYWIYYSKTFVLTQSTSFPGFNFPLVAEVYFNTATDRAIILEERHGINMPWAVHQWAHETIGCRYESGFTLTVSATTPSTFSITAGSLHDEDLDFTQGVKSRCRILYRNGSTAWEWDSLNTSLYKLNGANIRYNNGNALADVGTNRYTCSWVFGSNTNDTSNSIWVVMGQGEDITLAAARARTYSDLVLPDISNEIKILYRVIFQNATSPYVEMQDLRAVSTVSSGTFTATAHSGLSGLSYSLAAHTGFATGTSNKADSAGNADSLGHVRAASYDTGSGTANYISKWVSGKGLGNTAIRTDATNTNLGIATDAAPLYPVIIGPAILAAGLSQIAMTLSKGGGVSTSIYAGESNLLGIEFGWLTGTGAYASTSSSSYPFNFYVGGGPGLRMSLTNTECNIYKPMHYSGTDNINAIFENTATTDGTVSELQIKAGSQSNYLFSNNQNSTGYGGAGAFGYYAGQNGHYFYVGSTTNLLKISSTGVAIPAFTTAGFVKNNVTTGLLTGGNSIAITDLPDTLYPDSIYSTRGIRTGQTLWGKGVYLSTTASTGVTVQSKVTGGGEAYINLTDSTGWQIDKKGNNDIGFYNYTTNQWTFNITRDDKVGIGIGSTAPTRRLTVIGGVLCDTLSVNKNVTADSIFSRAARHDSLQTGTTTSHTTFTNRTIYSLGGDLTYNLGSAATHLFQVQGTKVNRISSTYDSIFVPTQHSSTLNMNENPLYLVDSTYIQAVYGGGCNYVVSDGAHIFKTGGVTNNLEIQPSTGTILISRCSNGLGTWQFQAGYNDVFQFDSTSLQTKKLTVGGISPVAQCSLSINLGTKNIGFRQTDTVASSGSPLTNGKSAVSKIVTDFYMRRAIRVVVQGDTIGWIPIMDTWNS